MVLLEETVATPKYAGVVRHVFPEQFRVLFLHHLAANLFKRETRLRRGDVGVSGRLAVDLECFWRFAGRRGHRPDDGAVRSAGWALRSGRSGIPYCRGGAADGAAFLPAG